MVNRRGFLGATAGLIGAWECAAQAQEPAKKDEQDATRKALKPVLPGPPSPPLKPDESISRDLAELRDKFKLPGMIGAVLRGETVAAIGAAGVRKLGSEDPMTIGDVVHLGSDTKAMTATLLGMLVEDDKLKWSSAIRDVFPGVAKSLHRDFRPVTLLQLLNHRAGLPENAPWWLLKGQTTTEKRRSLLAAMMKDAPLSKPGSTFAYSNVGYAIAGLMAEQVTGRSWETLDAQTRVQTDAAGDGLGRLRPSRHARQARCTLGARHHWHAEPDR